MPTTRRRKVRKQFRALHITFHSEALRRNLLTSPPCVRFVRAPFSAFNPAYLTSSSLLRLQLRDPSVSQNVLVQLYIVLTYLSSPLSKTLTLPPNKSVKDILLPLLKRVKRMIATSTPNGEELYKMVKEVDEAEWGEWKKEGCRAFEKEPGDEPQPPPKRKRLPNPKSEYDYGGSKDASEIKAAAKSMRSSIPKVESYLEDYVDALDPESGIDSEVRSDEERKKAGAK